MFPERWHDYLLCGTVIDKTNIICFKVPLKRSVFIFNYVTSNVDVWTVDRLLQQNPTIGAVIDLTNTSKYYDSKQVKRAGVLYKKIPVAGQVVPSEEDVKKFIDTIEEFTEKCPSMLIGVHCTHGVNRTGYMVCKYMQNKLHVSPKESLEKFESARGHKIERQNYIDNLLQY
ncbi:Protein tyrosine phosphatase 1 [Lonomia obliqua multiple nucleopolyhedrovirus]|uniref:Protein tyrosine phosphatase 1 n=1 Tax=Lonomia obliqua multiple nucleopolyhedrovirus TaxID=134394 RepID=A0A126FC86_9ABAC|nr:Protein tyrosine phosphatase 1 [Lonomia obliqua multiple nucleopolyhedrovirus]AKN81014.1 Protein tyrosine phosphatase 1 [Lonomia obliqua multiple nucleopolyhedrovirus]